MSRSYIVTLIFSFLIAICSYVHIFYSQRLSTFSGVDQLVIALAVYFLVQMWSSFNYIINGLVFVVLAGLSLLLLQFLQNEYADGQLKSYGTKASAIVTSAKYMSGPKSYPGIKIKFTYNSAGREYSHTIIEDVDDFRGFVEGDTIPIIYSSKDPDLYEEVGDDPR